MHILSGLALAAGSPTSALAGDPQVGDGGTGSFYQWQARIPAGQPRIVRASAFEKDKWLANAAVNDRILYSSHGGVGGRLPIIVSGGVYLPKGKAPRGGWPVIAWAHGTVGFPDICAPSFNGWSERDVAYLNNWLKEGYAVVASDYEGLGTDGAHPYLMTRSEAVGVLDAVVAAQHRYGLSRDVVIVGQSQGAHAATGAVLMRHALAPSLRVRGVVLTGWASSMEMPTLKMDSFDPFAALYMRFLPTYTMIDPDFRPESILTPAGRAIYEGYRTTCGQQGMLDFLAKRPVSNTLFTRDPGALEARAQPFRAYPPLRFDVPVFLGIGAKDEQTAPRAAFEGAKRACTLGSPMTIRVYRGLMHSPTVLRSQEESIPWVRAAFAGKVPPGNCATASFPDD